MLKFSLSMMYDGKVTVCSNSTFLDNLLPTNLQDLTIYLNPSPIHNRTTSCLYYTGNRMFDLTMEENGFSGKLTMFDGDLLGTVASASLLLDPRMEILVTFGIGRTIQKNKGNIEFAFVCEIVDSQHNTNGLKPLNEEASSMELEIIDLAKLDL